MTRRILVLILLSAAATLPVLVMAPQIILAVLLLAPVLFPFLPFFVGLCLPREIANNDHAAAGKQSTRS